MENNSYLEKFNRCVREYNEPLTEADMPEDPMPEGGPMPEGPMGGGQNMPQGGPEMGGEGNGQEPTGFNPEGVTPDQPIEGMGSEETQEVEPQEEEDEVIDVDDLTKAQEATAEKVDMLAGQFEKVLNSISGLEEKIQNIDNHTNEYLASIKSEIEKRNPTPMQRMNMISTKSEPYGMTPSEYMATKAPENYSAEGDDEGEKVYTITKGDIDSFNDYGTVANDLGMGKHFGLSDILDFDK